jgi:hypothetical protein
MVPDNSFTIKTEIARPAIRKANLDLEESGKSSPMKRDAL